MQYTSYPPFPREASYNVFPNAIAHTTQTAGITEAVSSSRGLGGRIVRFLITTWQDFSFWVRSIMGIVTAAEIQNFGSEKPYGMNSSIRDRLSHEEATNFFKWPQENDSRLMTQIAERTKEIKCGQVTSLAALISFPFLERLAASEPCKFKNLMMASDKTGNTLTHWVTNKPDTIAVFIPVLEALAKAAPLSFQGILKEMMMVKNENDITPIHCFMRLPTNIIAFISVQRFLAKTDPSSLHDILKEMMSAKDRWGYTPIRYAMKDIDTITALISVLKSLSDLGIGTEDLGKIMQADMGNGTTLIQKMQYALPTTDFESFLRNSAINIKYSSQTGNASLH